MSIYHLSINSIYKIKTSLFVWEKEHTSININIMQVYEFTNQWYFIIMCIWFVFK